MIILIFWIQIWTNKTGLPSKITKFKQKEFIFWTIYSWHDILLNQQNINLRWIPKKIVCKKTFILLLKPPPKTIKRIAYNFLLILFGILPEFIIKYIKGKPFHFYRDFKVYNLSKKLFLWKNNTWITHMHCDPSLLFFKCYHRYFYLSNIQSQFYFEYHHEKDIPI